MKKEIKIKSYLPIFKGFYNTIFEPCLDNDENFSEAQIESFDNTSYENDIAKELCKIFVKQLKENTGIEIAIEYEEVESPKEYNYRNDAIYCTISLDIDFINGLNSFLEIHKTGFTEYLKDHFTSCSGFSSYYFNTFEKWQEKTKNFTSFDSVEIASILEYIAIDNDINEMSLYYDVIENVSIYNYI